jgi:hypothetical protein
MLTHRHSLAIGTVFLAVIVLVNPVGAQEATPVATEGVARWCDFQAATFQVRYRAIETNTRLVTSNQFQDSVLLRGRLKADAGGHLTLNASLATGSTLTSGWNNTGLGWAGAGAFGSNLYVKQLYIGAVPVHGIDVEYGGLSALRGESTEITNLDNDTYLVGERLRLRRPKDVWFDEVAVSLLYLGDASTPSVTRRLTRLKQINYRQVLLGKTVGRRTSASAEFARYLAVDTVRLAASIKTPESKVFDLARVEVYRRLGSSGATGFVVYGEKKVLGRLTVGGGYADIDKGLPIGNGDRYMKGKRVFGSTAVTLVPNLSATFFITQAHGNTFAIPNWRRTEVVVGYNALPVIHQLMSGH